MKNLAADNVKPGDTVHKMPRVNRESVVLRSKVDRRQLVRGTKWIAANWSGAQNGSGSFHPELSSSRTAKVRRSLTAPPF